MDPTEKEEALCLSSLKNKKKNSINHGVIMQAMLLQHDQISEFFFAGSMDTNCLIDSVEILKKASNEIYPLLEDCLTKYVYKMLKKKKNDDKIN